MAQRRPDPHRAGCPDQLPARDHVSRRGSRLRTVDCSTDPALPTECERRDPIASTVHTIVVAYAGAALPLLLLSEVYPTPIWTRVTSSALAEEVIRTLVGAIALVLADPVTTAAGAFSATAADAQAGKSTERRMTAQRARFTR